MLFQITRIKFIMTQNCFFLSLTEKQRQTTKTILYDWLISLQIQILSSKYCSVENLQVLLGKTLLLCINDRLTSKLFFYLLPNNTIMLAVQVDYPIGKRTCVKGTPTWTFTFHCSFEEDFAAATGHYSIMTSGSLIPTYQTYFGRSWGSSRNTS